jgi:hypothetical protein
MQVRIFAKHGTDEKVIIACPRPNVGQVMEALCKADGGRWLLVDDLKVNEIVRFNDGQKYQGYSPKINRYCSKIEILPL